jgi:hypothetical protein
LARGLRSSATLRSVSGLTDPDVSKESDALIFKVHGVVGLYQLLR